MITFLKFSFSFLVLISATCAWAETNKDSESQLVSSPLYLELQAKCVTGTQSNFDNAIESCENISGLLAKSNVCKSLSCMRLSTCWKELSIASGQIKDAISRKDQESSITALKSSIDNIKNRCIKHENETLKGISFNGFTNWASIKEITSDSRESNARENAIAGKNKEAGELYEKLWKDLKHEIHAYYAAILFDEAGIYDKALANYMDFFASEPTSPKSMILNRLISIEKVYRPNAGTNAIFAQRLEHKHAYLYAAQFYSIEPGQPHILSAANAYLNGGAPDAAISAARSYLSADAGPSPEKTKAEKIISVAETQVKPLKESTLFFQKNRFIQAANVLLDDPNTRNKADYVCMAGRILDRWNGDIERAKKLYKQCLTLDPHFYDAKFIQGRIDDLILGGPEMVPINDVNPKYKFTGSKVSWGCDECCFSLYNAEYPVGYQFVQTVPLPEGYLYDSNTVEIKEKQGEVSYEVRPSPSKRNVFIKMTAKESGCTCFFGTFGDGSKLQIDFTFNLKPYPMPSISEPAPKEANPFHDGQIMRRGGYPVPKPASTKCPEADPKPSSCKLRANADVDVIVYAENLCGQKGAKLYDLSLKKDSVRTINAPTDRIRYDYRLSNDAYHGDVGTWCHKGGIDVTVP